MKVSTLVELLTTELTTAVIAAATNAGVRTNGGGVTVKILDKDGTEVLEPRAIVNYNWAATPRKE